jgi:hypothetical protein
MAKRQPGNFLGESWPNLLPLQLPLDPFPRFFGKFRGRAKFIRALLRRLMQKMNLFTIAPAPFADQQMQKKPEPPSRRKRMFQRVGLRVRRLAAAWKRLRAP